MSASRPNRPCRHSQTGEFRAVHTSQGHFKNLLKGGTFTHKQEYIYLTHRKLSPTRKDQSGYETKMGMLNPQQYRKMYSDLVSLGK